MFPYKRSCSLGLAPFLTPFFSAIALGFLRYIISICYVYRNINIDPAIAQGQY